MKKIMFNDKYGLTQAVLEGRKTQTRRNFTLTLHKKEVIGKGLIEVSPTKVYFEEGKWKFVYDDYVFLLPLQNCPKYKVGEVVAVAQSYRDCGGLNEAGVPRWDIISKSVGAINPGWDNKMFVRADLMPHHIRITDVRVERLQDISDEDCFKEGIRRRWHAPACRSYYYVPGVAVKSVDDVYDTPREAFARLIDKVSKKGAWESNPYVYVYEFELVD